MSAGRVDTGVVRKLISLARPARPASSGKRPDSVAIADYPPPPPTLKLLTEGSDAIVVGQVAGILRTAHSPENSPYAEQNTVYVVAVENYFKTGASGVPGIVKVLQPGGMLPWQDKEDKLSGVGWHIANSPMLVPGSRYILFLKHPGDRPNAFENLGFVPAEGHGIYGRDAYLDEYILVGPILGQLLLVNGLTEPPLVEGRPYPWRFEMGGPQILGVSEGQALAAIANAVTASASSSRN